MKYLLMVAMLVFAAGCRSGLETSDDLRAIGTVTRVTPSSGEGKSRKGVAFEFRVLKPASSRGLVISYEVMPFSILDVLQENDVVSMVGKKVSIRILKSDLKEASPDVIFLRTPSSLEIRLVGSSSPK